MINYRLKNKSDIHETQTDQIIQSISDEKKAKERLKHLNLGGGSDGWTPAFFLIEFKYILHKKNFTS